MRFGARKLVLFAVHPDFRRNVCHSVLKYRMRMESGIGVQFENVARPSVHSLVAQPLSQECFASGIDQFRAVSFLFLPFGVSQFRPGIVGLKSSLNEFLAALTNLGVRWGFSLRTDVLEEPRVG